MISTICSGTDYIANTSENGYSGGKIDFFVTKFARIDNAVRLIKAVFCL